MRNETLNTTKWRQTPFCWLLFARFIGLLASSSYDNGTELINLLLKALNYKIINNMNGIDASNIENVLTIQNSIQIVRKLHQ